MKQAYLLTGSPGVGKTTIIKEVLAKVKATTGGFYTEEIRSGGIRQGFRIVTLDGKSAILAHINIHSPYQVSKYGVDIDSLDQVGVSALREATHKCDIVIVDEIGKMELYSPSFKEAVTEALESGKKVLGTIMLKPHPWADRIKQHHLVKVISVTMVNYREVAEEVLSWLQHEIGEELWRGR